MRPERLNALTDGVVAIVLTIMKAHTAAINAVQKGDEVITGGGIRGKATKITDNEVEVEIAQGVKVRVVKSTLSQVFSKNAKPAND